MDETPSRRTILQAVAGIPFLATATSGAQPDELHEARFRDDLVVKNRRDDSVTATIRIESIDGSVTFERTIPLGGRTASNDHRIEQLSAPAGRYRVTVELDGETATTEIPLSPQDQREYERVDARVLPDRISLHQAVI